MVILHENQSDIGFGCGKLHQGGDSSEPEALQIGIERGVALGTASPQGEDARAIDAASARSDNGDRDIRAA